MSQAFSRAGVVWMLLAGTTINYIDRQALSVLAPTLARELKFSSLEYSYILNSFLAVYSVSYLCVGAFVDRLGTRRGLGLAVIWWSLAEIAHAFVGGLTGLCLARAALAVGEAAIIPGGVKAVAEWFEEKRRGIAIATFEIGLSIGPILAPPLVAWISLTVGWRSAFLWTGAAGLLWTIPWLIFYRKPEPAVGHVKSKAPAGPSSWSALLRSRKVAAVGIGRLFGDPVWYFYLFWLPKFFSDSRHLDLRAIGGVSWIPFLAAMLGGLTGGSVSSWLIRRGVPVLEARRRVLLASAVVVSAGVASVYAGNLFQATVAVSLGAFALQCWGVNLDTLPADLVRSDDVARVVGLCGLMGSLGGIGFTAATGYLVQHYSYTPVWIATAVMYPAGYLALHRLLRA